MMIVNHDIGFPSSVSEDMKELILKMMMKEEDERITINDILAKLHSWK